MYLQLLISNAPGFIHFFIFIIGNTSTVSFKFSLIQQHLRLSGSGSGTAPSTITFFFLKQQKTQHKNPSEWSRCLVSLLAFTACLNCFGHLNQGPLWTRTETTHNPLHEPLTFPFNGSLSQPYSQESNFDYDIRPFVWLLSFYSI